MKELVFEIESNEELWTLIDKRFDHILVHKFTPNRAINWWTTDIIMENRESFKDLKVRNMEFDISTDLNGLKRILALNTLQLRIYQFDKPLPNTLSLDYLPANNREKILLQNGLKHCYFCDFEFLTISSFTDEFIDEIANSEQFKARIEERKSALE